MLLRMDLLHSFIFNFEFIFNWRIILSQNCVGFYQISVNQPWVYICLLPLETPFPSHPSRLLQSPSLSSLSHTAYFTLFYGWVLFLYVCVLACVYVHLLDLFLCQWTFRSLLSLNYCKQCQDTMLVHLSFQIMVFSRCMLRNEIAGSYDVSIFSVL